MHKPSRLGGWLLVAGSSALTALSWWQMFRCASQQAQAECDAYEQGRNDGARLA